MPRYAPRGGDNRLPGRRQNRGAFRAAPELNKRLEQAKKQKLIEDLLGYDSQERRDEKIHVLGGWFVRFT